MIPSVPLGRLTAEQASRISAIAAESGGDLRLAPWRGIVLGSVAKHRAADITGQLQAVALSCDGRDGFDGIAACAGNTGCDASLADCAQRCGCACTATCGPRSASGVDGQFLRMRKAVRDAARCDRGTDRDPRRLQAAPRRAAHPYHLLAGVCAPGHSCFYLRGRFLMHYIKDGAAIYRESFSIIRSETDLSAFPPDLARVVVRMIHACGHDRSCAVGPGIAGCNRDWRAGPARRRAHPVRCDDGGQRHHPRTAAAQQRDPLHPDESCHRRTCGQAAKPRAAPRRSSYGATSLPGRWW